tara:strand:+ start:58127 stop:58879 length:753 start_codon:yes stop_codon:yes gene_type:complete
MDIRTVLVPLLISTTLGLAACDQNSSGSDSIDQVNKDIAALNEQSRENQRRQIEEEGVANVDDEHLNEMGNILENAAENSTGKQAEILREQASLIRELQSSVQAYDEILDELVTAGGIDASTVTSADDIANRIDIVDRLDAQNERMAIAQPRILRRMGEIEGTSATIEKQIVIHNQIREIDRQLFTVMRGILNITGDHLDGMQVLDDGSVMFGEDMPDEVLAEYNALIDEVNQLSANQGQLQLELLKLAP